MIAAVCVRVGRPFWLAPVSEGKRGANNKKHPGLPVRRFHLSKRTGQAKIVPSRCPRSWFGAFEERAMQVKQRHRCLSWSVSERQSCLL
jgi:hypothetical protein